MVIEINASTTFYFVRCTFYWIKQCCFAINSIKCFTNIGNIWGFYDEMGLNVELFPIVSPEGVVFCSSTYVSLSELPGRLT